MVIKDLQQVSFFRCLNTLRQGNAFNRSFAGPSAFYCFGLQAVKPLALALGYKPRFSGFLLVETIALNDTMLILKHGYYS